MSSSSSPPDGPGYAAYLPRIDRSLLAELAGQLRPCCEPPLEIVIPKAEAISLPAMSPLSTERPSALPPLLPAAQPSPAAPASTTPADRDAAQVRPVQVRPNRARPTEADLDGALSAVRRAAALVDEFQVHAIPPERFAEIQREIVKLESRVSDYERDFEIVADELRFARRETEAFRERSLAAETKLEALTAAVGRMFETLSPQLATGGPARSTLS